MLELQGIPKGDTLWSGNLFVCIIPGGCCSQNIHCYWGNWNKYGYNKQPADAQSLHRTRTGDVCMCFLQGVNMCSVMWKLWAQAWSETKNPDWSSPHLPTTARCRSSNLPSLHHAKSRPHPSLPHTSRCRSILLPLPHARSLHPLPRHFVWNHNFQITAHMFTLRKIDANITRPWALISIWKIHGVRGREDLIS